MAFSIPDTLDVELNVIFDNCSEEGQDKASIDKLASVCVDKYAPGQSELKEIILSKLNTGERNSYITRSDFITKLKAWIGERESLSADFEPSLDDSYFSFSCDEKKIATSTPRRIPKFNQCFLQGAKMTNDESGSQETPSNCWNGVDRSKERLRDKTFLLESGLTKTELKLHDMMKKNDSLEARLTKSEQRNQSLEFKIKKLTAEMAQKSESLENERKQLLDLLSETLDSLKTYKEQCLDLKSKNVHLESQLEKCLCTELIPKNEELQQELFALQKETSSALRDKEYRIVCLEKELTEAKDNEASNAAVLSALKDENKSLLFNQQELLNTIGDLRNEKKSLQDQVDEAHDLQTSFSNVDHNKNFIGKQGEFLMPAKLRIKSVVGFKIPENQSSTTCPSTLDIFTESGGQILTRSSQTQTTSATFQDISTDVLELILTSNVGTQTTSATFQDIGTDILEIFLFSNVGTQTLSSYDVKEVSTDVKELLLTFNKGTQILTSPTHDASTNVSEDFLNYNLGRNPLSLRNISRKILHILISFFCNFLLIWLTLFIITECRSNIRWYPLGPPPQ